jgi:hypothetical protein
MTKTSAQKAAFVITKDETDHAGTATAQIAVPIPRDVGRWYRHYALDQGLSMAELIRRILRGLHGRPWRARRMTVLLGH